VVVEPHPVDERAVLGQSKEPRTRVTGLWLGGDAADLDVAEAQTRKRARYRGVLVEARGHSHWVGELVAERVDPQAVVGDAVPGGECSLDGGVLDRRQPPVDESVGGLGREPEQEGFQRVVGVHRLQLS
jgi:hypothetical protein